MVWAIYGDPGIKPEVYEHYCKLIYSVPLGHIDPEPEEDTDEEVIVKKEEEKQVKRRLRAEMCPARLAEEPEEDNDGGVSYERYMEHLNNPTYEPRPQRLLNGHLSYFC